MTQKGELVTCDRCRRMTFLAENERHEYDTRPLHGWFIKDSMPTTVFGIYPNTDFCPTCYARFKRLHEENRRYFAQLQNNEFDEI